MSQNVIFCLGCGRDRLVPPMVADVARLCGPCAEVAAAVKAGDETAKRAVRERGQLRGLRHRLKEWLKGPVADDPVGRT